MQIYGLYQHQEPTIINGRLHYKITIKGKDKMYKINAKPSATLDKLNRNDYIMATIDDNVAKSIMVLK
ncbi:MAG TPA: hypothetical protein PKL04_00715 [Methanofastidiosum sp.]|nr:hypothetical protein [Methanofastidiosum sp.]